MSTTSRPAHHANDVGTSFKNPWPSADVPTLAELSRQPFPVGLASSLPTLRANPLARPVQVVTPDWGQSALETEFKLNPNLVKNETYVIGTWLGHASALVEMPLHGMQGRAMATAGGPTTQAKKRLWMLFDPIFSERAGPTRWTGPRRFRETPCHVADLPGCDIVFVSHNHYDHLDLGSVEALLRRFPRARYCVPLGMRQWFVETGVPGEWVWEMDWWGVRELGMEDLGYRVASGKEVEGSEQAQVRVTCVPAQHNSGRAGVDAGGTLWCGWVVEQFVTSTVDGQDSQSRSKAKRRGAVYHAGDTGYRRSAKSDVVCPAFEEIGRKLGPFDLSFIPIWRGGSLGFISYLGLRLSHNDVPSTLHGSPTDAVSIHCDVKSKNTVGIHFGTFVGSENETYEAVIEFGEACQEQGLRSLDDRAEGEHGRAGTLDIGASLLVEIERGCAGSWGRVSAAIS